jgi:AcrR family transcriptional regulator
MGRKRLTGEERRDQILDIAALEFSKHGLEATRIKDIAETCGINEALIYQHFPCKEDLYLAAMAHVQTEMLGGWIAVIDRSTTSLDALQMFLLNRIRLMFENRHLVAAVEHFLLASLTDDRMQKLNVTLFSAVQDLIEQLVRRGQEDGSIRKDLDPVSIAYWIRGFSYLVNASVIMGVKERLPFKKTEEHLNNLINILRPVNSDKKVQAKSDKVPKRAKKPAAKKSGSLKKKGKSNRH